MHYYSIASNKYTGGDFVATSHNLMNDNIGGTITASTAEGLAHAIGLPARLEDSETGQYVVVHTPEQAKTTIGYWRIRADERKAEQAMREAGSKGAIARMEKGQW